MDLSLILTLLAASALAAFPLAYIQHRVADWTEDKAGHPRTQRPPLIQTAIAFFIRAVVLIAILALFRYLLSE